MILQHIITNNDVNVVNKQDTGCYLRRTCIFLFSLYEIRMVTTELNSGFEHKLLLLSFDCLNLFPKKHAEMTWDTTNLYDLFES